MADDIGGVWRTIGGRRVFIKTGATLDQAMKESGKFKNLGKKVKNKRKEKEIKNEKEVMDKFIENNPRWEDGDYDTDEFDDVAATLGISRDEVANQLYDRIYEKAHEGNNRTDKETFEKISKFYGYDKFSNSEIENILKFAEEKHLYHSQKDIDAMRRYLKQRKNS